MNEVLLIVHDVYQNDNEFPLGIGYITSYLEQHDIPVDVCCSDVYHYTDNELIDKYLVNNYEHIGIGFMAARFKETVLPLCKLIKNNCESKLILGGHGASPIPEYIRKTTKADHIVIGEGEKAMLHIIQNRPKEKTIRVEPIRQLDSIPFPAWHKFPMDIYTTNMQYPGQEEDEKAMQIITSRGCTNKCSFCYRMEKGIRFRSIKNVLDEMMYLYVKYDVTYFVIQDELFVANKKRLEQFIQGLKDTGLYNNIKYNISVGIRADVADEQFAEQLKTSGCQYVNIGFESMDQQCLNELNKNTTWQENCYTAEIMNKYGVPMGINFIWGIMSDNKDTLQQSVDFIKQHNAYSELRTIRPITPYPGCTLYDYAKKHNLLKDDDDFFNKFKNSDLLTVNFTNIPDDEYYRLLFVANTELIIDHYKNNGFNSKEATDMIEKFYNLYFKGKTKFRGARHFEKRR